MFKTLRNRLLLMNLIIISILMLVSFGTIYFIMSNNINETIKMDLFRISDFDRSVKNTLPKFDVFGDRLPEPEGEPLEESENRIPKERLTAFIIHTDTEFNVKSHFSYFEADDSFFSAALAFVEKREHANGRFDLDNSHWAYRVQSQPSGYVISFMDISTQKSVLDRLILTFIVVSLFMLLIIYYISTFLTDRAIQPIKEAFDRQRQFVSDASHELRTPLAVIQTNVELLLENSRSEEKKWLEYIKTEVERMGGLTTDLLYLTQVDQSNASNTVKTSINLTEKLEHLLLGFEVMAYEKDLSLNYRLNSDVQILCNGEQISQVLVVLLDNALKYTPSGGSVDVTLDHTSAYAIVEVKNTGLGISEEDIHKIFDRFYRVDPSRSRRDGSYGLGLSIAKSIVDQQGGKLTCDSVVNAYTRFTLKLKK